MQQIDKIIKNLPDYVYQLISKYTGLSVENIKKLEN